FLYDNQDRLTRTTDNIGNTHDFSYDSRNNETVQIDARGNIVHQDFDGLNRRTQTIQLLTTTGDGTGAFFDSILTRDIWDDSSRLAVQIDDNGNETTHSYDSLNRSIMETEADGTAQHCSFDVHDNKVGI